MNLSGIGDPLIHDLLRIDPDCLIAGCVAQPSWVRESLITCPWAVVRRAQAPVGQIAVGVRGTTRSERWGGFCAKSLISAVVRPADVLVLAGSSSRTLRTAALKVFQVVIERWRDLSLPWGPAGSAGFELATGRQVTSETSDLDLVIRAPFRIPVEQARSLWHRVTGLQVKVDARVETPECGFALEEYASSISTRNSRILLRYPDGSRFGDDPWRERPKLEATAS
jgi:phosphoribosyl-dephospho-CoA transferase